MRELTKEHIGKRLLVKEDSYYGEVREAGVLEVSPSNSYIKIQFVRNDNSTYTNWVKKDEYILVEELNSVMDNVTEAVERFENFKKSLNKKKGKNKSYWEKDNVLPKPYQ